MNLIAIAENRLVPTSFIRKGIRALCARRLKEEMLDFQTRKEALVAELRSCPIAIETDAANRQHYEVPAALYQRMLGDHLKYSCCHWPDGVHTLSEAEAAALQLVAERAAIEDGMSILDLGCGWGSFSLWAAEQFPNSRVTGVSNSNSQREFILARARERGLDNLEIITADMNTFQPPVDTFDRAVSIEMFEHMRNYEELLHRVAASLVDGGRLFVHVFSHKDCAYKFEDRGSDDWMAKYFFTGGIMPSHDLLPMFGSDFDTVDQWAINGRHYQKTAEAWLENLDRHKAELLPVLADCYGKADARLWHQRWRIFVLACAELWGYRAGEEWGVSHYLFQKKRGKKTAGA